MGTRGAFGAAFRVKPDIALVLETTAHMAFATRGFTPGVAPAPTGLQDRHYFRKHGKNAYYGQSRQA